VAVNAITFSIAQGETVGLLGPNGAGKTTAIAMISGISKPDGGQVTLNGVSLARDGQCIQGPRGAGCRRTRRVYEELSAWANLRSSSADSTASVARNYSPAPTLCWRWSVWPSAAPITS